MRWSLLGLSLAVLVLWARGSLPAFNLLHQAVPGYAAAVMLAAPAVVNIEALSSTRDSENPLTNDPVFRDFFGQTSAADNEHRASSLGSGVILDPSGVVLTNYHVIRGSEAIRVSLADGRSSPGRVIGTDPDSDLAVLKINLENLPSVVVGQSDDLRVGDIVLAVGNALGIGQHRDPGHRQCHRPQSDGYQYFREFHSGPTPRLISEIQGVHSLTSAAG